MNGFGVFNDKTKCLANGQLENELLSLFLN